MDRLSVYRFAILIFLLVCLLLLSRNNSLLYAYTIRIVCLLKPLAFFIYFSALNYCFIRDFSVLNFCFIRLILLFI